MTTWPRPGGGDAIRILLVDDEADIVELFSMVLERRGHSCAIASTGHHALELVESFRPHLLLLDIGLPDIDGYQVARQVRASRGNTIFIAAVTGWGKREDREKAFAAGIDTHLTKPVNEGALLEVLARVARMT